MIAFLILAAGLLALMTMQIISIKANAFSSEMTYSTMLAQQQLETLRNQGFNNLAPGNYTLPPIIDDTGATYTVSYTVTNTTSTMDTIVLNVVWQSPRLGTSNQTVAQQAVTTTMQTVLFKGNNAQGNIP
jgi:hypothetical protein